MKSVFIIGLSCLAAVAATIDKPKQEIEKPVLREKNEYPSDEKEKWVYYDNVGLTEEQTLARERMWKMDMDLQKARGTIQGYARGFYKDYNYELPELCMGRDFLRYLYYIQLLGINIDGPAFVDIMGLVYGIYYSLDVHRQLEQWMYDLSIFCFSHSCDPEQLLKNEMGAVFQVTGALNAMAAVFYEDPPEDD